MKIFATVMAAIVVGGCTLTPDYHRPRSALANNPNAHAPFVADTSHVSRGQPAGPWWRLYNDPLLDRLVEEALTANTDMRIAVANLNRASAQLDVVSDARLPQTDVGAEATYGRASAEQQFVPQQLPNMGVYALLGSVSYQVDLFGQVRRAVESAGANRDATKAALAATRIAVVAQTVAAYLSVCSAGRETLVTRHAIDLQIESTRLARRLESRGRTGSLDVTRSLTQEYQLRSSLPPLEAAKETALNHLAVLTGHPLAELPAGVEACNQEPLIQQLIPVGDGRGLLARRPDIAAAEAELHAATADLGVATADLYPNITLGASGGSVGLIGHFADSDTYEFSIGPLISWHFPNRRRAHGQIAEAQAQIDASVARFDARVLTALEEVQSALDVYARDLDRMNDLHAAHASATKADTDALALYTLGREGYLSVLDADRQLASIDQLVAAQQTKIANDQVQLFLALGGGWQQ